MTDPWTPATAYTNLCDPVKAVMDILAETCSGLSVIADGRVYGQELPEQEVGAQPRAAIVVASAPSGEGFGDKDYRRVSVNRVDVRCYGESVNDAAVLSIAVHDALKRWRNGQTTGKALVHACMRVAGPVFYRSPAADTPVMVRTYDVQHADELVA